MRSTTKIRPDRRMFGRMLLLGLIGAFGLALAGPDRAEAEGPLVMVATEADTCGDHDYDCWYDFFTDMFPKDDATEAETCGDKDYDCWYDYFTDMFPKDDAAEAETCGDKDYDCWYDYFTDMFPKDDDTDGDGGGDDGGDGSSNSTPRQPDGQPEDLSSCVLGIDYAGLKCVEDYTEEPVSLEPERGRTFGALALPTPPARR